MKKFNIKEWKDKQLNEAMAFRPEIIANYLKMEYNKAEPKLRDGYKGHKDEKKIEKALKDLEKAHKNLIKVTGIYKPFDKYKPA